MMRDTSVDTNEVSRAIQVSGFGKFEKFREHTKL